MIPFVRPFLCRGKSSATPFGRRFPARTVLFTVSAEMLQPPIKKRQDFPITLSARKSKKRGPDEAVCSAINLIWTNNPLTYLLCVYLLFNEQVSCWACSCSWHSPPPVSSVLSEAGSAVQREVLSPALPLCKKVPVRERPLQMMAALPSPYPREMLFS